MQAAVGGDRGGASRSGTVVECIRVATCCQYGSVLLVLLHVRCEGGGGVVATVAHAALEGLLDVVRFHVDLQVVAEGEKDRERERVRRGKRERECYKADLEG